MTYHFAPDRMRQTRAEILRRFPARNDRSRALTLLFRMLQQIALTDYAQWSGRLSVDEVDLVCRFYHLAPNTRALLGVFLLLAYRDDKRAAEVLDLYLHRLPPDAELAELRRLWPDLPIRDQVAGKGRWMDRFLSETDQDTAAYVCDSLRAGWLNLTELGEWDRQTPLLDAVTTFLFEEAVALLDQLPAAIVCARALTYLRAGAHDKIRRFLSHANRHHWEPEFLQTLRGHVGPPDPSANEFYRGMEEGRLWALRDQMFGLDLVDAKLDNRRRDFWLRWLYRCREWRPTSIGALIWIGPLMITEEAGRTLIAMAESPKQIFETLPLDDSWTVKIGNVFAEYIRVGR